jgi:multiple sugar transport system substrate-binding protein
MLNRFTYQGQLWGLPSEGTTYVIEYNKDLFDAAGVDYPTVDPTDLGEVWTTDDFLEIAVALTSGEDEAKVYGLVTNYYEVNDLVFLMERLGAVLVDQSVDPPTIDFSDPSVVEALRWYADLSTEYGVKPIYIGDIADILTSPTLALEREAVINESRAAMWTATGTTNVLGGREGLNVGVAPLPVGTAGTGGAYVSAEGYFISAGTEARQACWQWITFLTDQPEAVQNIPARRSVAESAAFRGQVGDERAAAYLATMAATDRPSSLQFLEDEPWMGVSLIWLGRAYAQTVDDELPVEEALSQVQDTFDAYRACVISRDAMSDDQEQQDCVMEIDPSFPAFIFGE